MTADYMPDNNSYQRNDQIKAAVITFIAVVIIGLIIAFTKLVYIPGAAQVWPPVDSSEILFEGEYVMAGDVETPQSQNSEPAQMESVEEPVTDGPDLTDAGDPSPVPPPVTTSTQPSPMKVNQPKEEEKTGPTKAEIEAEKAKAKQAQETQQKIAGRMNFGSNTSSGNGTGKQGSPNGNSNVGAVSGAPGYSLEGRTLAHWVLPAKTAPNGSVTVRVVVNQQGKVIDASVASSSGAAANEAIRSACVAAAKKSSFSVKLDAPPRQSGTISYKFVSK